MTDDLSAPLGDPVEEAFVTELWQRYDRVVDAIVDERPTAVLVSDLLQLSDGHPERDDVVAAVADALTELLEDADPTPEGEDPWPWSDLQLRVLEALRQVVVTEGLAGLAGVLLLGIDRETDQELVELRAGQALALATAEHPLDDPSEPHVVRGFAREARGDLTGAAADFVAAFHLATDDERRGDCALLARYVLAALEQVDEAADWGWTAARLRGPALERDDAEGVIASQLAVLLAAEAAGTYGGSTRVTHVLDRLDHLAPWLPDDQVSTVHVLIASARCEQNDPSGADRHLRTAEPGLDDDTALRAMWHVVSGDVGVLLGDTARVERESRAAASVMGDGGDPQVRARLTMQAMWLSGVYGRPVAEVGEVPLTTIHRVQQHLGRKQVLAEDLTALDHARSEAIRLGQPQLAAMALLLRAALRRALGAPLDVVLADLAQAEGLVEAARAERVGGWPYDAFLEMVSSLRTAILSLERGATPEASEREWRRAQQSGRRQTVVPGALIASLLWLRDGQPDRALAAAVAALTTQQDVVSTRQRSDDRSVLGVLAGAAAQAYRAAAATGDPRLMAELLEVARAQDMPVSGEAVPSVVELAASLALEAVRTAVDESAESHQETAPARTMTTRLRPPPRIVMPWGTEALAELVAYDPALARGRAQLALDWPDLSKT